MVIFAIALLLLAGIGSPIQGVYGYKIDTQVGNSYVPGLGFALTSILLFVVLTFTYDQVPTWQQITNIPTWTLISGATQAFYFVTVTICPPVIGIGLMAVGLLAGQILGGALIDTFGLFGMPIRELSMMQISGCIILLAGCSLMALIQAKSSEENA